MRQVFVDIGLKYYVDLVSFSARWVRALANSGSYSKHLFLQAVYLSPNPLTVSKYLFNCITTHLSASS
jgi:hypothetical protein